MFNEKEGKRVESPGLMSIGLILDRFHDTGSRGYGWTDKLEL